MNLELDGKRVLITAASRGLGRAAALSLAAEGASLAVAGRNTAAMGDLLEELRAAGAAKAVAVHIDLSDRDTLAKGVAEAAKELGGIDVFLGNTGGPDSGPFVDVPRAAWEEALGDSLLPLVDLTHAVLPYMQKNGWGRIMYVTTVGVKMVQPNMVLSDSIRLAIVGMAKSLSIEVAHEGITVNCLCPGPFKTDRMEYLVTSSMERDNLDRAAAEALWLEEVPAGQFGDPADFGAMVALLSSNRGSFINGQAIALDGGKSRAY